VGFSSHKFFGTPSPAGVILVRRDALGDARHVDYIDGIDSTDAGCRSGHAVLELWYALALYGREGHHRRAMEARAVAAHLVEQLEQLAWRSWRAQPEAFTVMLETPPASISQRWALASNAHGWSHFICMPGVTRHDVDAFVADLAVAIQSIPTARTAVG
jgi:histidine decarboxylase